MTSATVGDARAWFDTDGWKLEEAELRGGLVERGADEDLVVELIDEGADRRRGAMSNGNHPAVVTQSEHVPLQSLEAEESVLGSMMISPGAIQAVEASGLQAGDFYWRERHGFVYQAILDLHAKGEPVDAITLTHELERRSQLEAIGGRVRLHELAALVPASANAAHYARIVNETAQQRAFERVGQAVVHAARNGGVTPGLRADLEAQLSASGPTPHAPNAALTGFTHTRVLDLELPPERYLVDGLIPMGAVGTIAGVPETHKSWLAQAIAVRVAAGAGEILGCTVSQAGRVGYLWQDDSTAAEAQRVKDFESVHPAPTDLSLWWFLNQGLQLPADMARIAATVRDLQLDLLVIDSFYNFLAGADLKAEDAERVVASLKQEIADPTGCTVLIVDHMPWATETNRGRLRAYGGVFKNAATRFGIYIDARDGKTWIEARGNNIRGFKKTLAHWDGENLELRLIDGGDHNETVEQRATAVLEHLIEHPGSHSSTAIRKAVGGRGTITDEALLALKERDVVKDHVRDGGTWSSANGVPRYWIATVHAASHGIGTTSQLPGTRSDEVGPGSPEGEPRPVPSIGDEVYRDVVEDEVERLADKHGDLA